MEKQVGRRRNNHVESAIDHNAAQVGIILEPLTMTNDNNLITAYIQV